MEIYFILFARFSQTNTHLKNGNIAQGFSGKSAEIGHR
jgi:hypothetical protein